MQAAEIFAANRAQGRIDLHAAARDGVTRTASLREEGALRVRFPNAAAGAAEAVLINTAGGIAGGDRFEFALTLAPDARLTVTTAAAEKVYRALDASSTVDVRLKVGAGARLSWLPQETILFDRACLARRFEVDLSEGASLLMAEALVFGRSAHGETVETGALVDQWRIRRGGRLVLAETTRLAGAIAARMRAKAVANGAVALATLIAVPGDDTHAAAMRAAAEGCAGEVGISAWNGLCVARFCAHNGAALRADMTALLASLQAPLPRIWLN